MFPVATYGCESWTLSKKEVRQIDAFELWVWRRLLRTPWTERKTNEWVLQQINEDNTITRSLVNIIRKGRLCYFGHIIRQHNSLEKTIMQGKVEGKRGRGRPKKRWIDSVFEDLHGHTTTIRGLINLASEREICGGDLSIWSPTVIRNWMAITTTTTTTLSNTN